MSLGSVMEQTSLLRDWNELEDEGDHELSVLKGYRKLTRPSFEHTTSSVYYPGSLPVWSLNLQTRTCRQLEPPLT